MIEVAGVQIGEGCPAAVVAEVGINHNADVRTALKLVDAAADAGAGFVKFQVGNPELYVNRAEWSGLRETPWGTMPYIDYRKRMELSDDQLRALQAHAHDRGLVWFASALDAPTVERLDGLNVPLHKIASPMLTDGALLRALQISGKPVLLSTGMSTIEEIDAAVGSLRGLEVVVLHCVSKYPCPDEDVNLACIGMLRNRYGCPTGYSGHEIGIGPSVWAAGKWGACLVERHLTLSRAMWGSDHAASLEPKQLETLVRYIRSGETADGDGVKRIHDAERVNMKKFRRKTSVEVAA